MMRNIWLDGMMGLVTGDALGNPVQFMSRNEVKRRGLVTTMEAGGAYNTPAGTWTDDSSMALATLDSIREVLPDLDTVMTAEAPRSWAVVQAAWEMASTRLYS